MTYGTMTYGDDGGYDGVNHDTYRASAGTCRTCGRAADYARGVCCQCAPDDGHARCACGRRADRDGITCVTCGPPAAGYIRPRFLRHV